MYIRNGFGALKQEIVDYDGGVYNIKLKYGRLFTLH